MYIIYLSPDFRLLKSGADPTCDHWHDGPGFSTAHMALTLMYEQALQAVNPSIAIPYWDFTVVCSARPLARFPTRRTM